MKHGQILKTLKEVQSDYFNSKARFNVCACGRRSGKTHLAKLRARRRVRYIEGPHFVSAPTYGQVKRLYWKDMKEILGPITKGKPSESELVINTVYDSELHLIGLDRPERVEGVPWRSGLLDEFADTKPEAWLENVRPALSTPGLNATADIIGVPDGLNHFFDAFDYAKTDGKEWRAHSWHSSIILTPEEIEAAKRELDPRTYRQEYEASFETASGRVYDDYSDMNHTDKEAQPGDLIWSHDFNFLPLSSFIAQWHGGEVHCVDEIVLEHAIAIDTAREFCERYNGHNGRVIIYGDPSGKAGEKHGHLSDYLIIEEELRRKGFRVERRVLPSTRSIKDSQASLRGIICNALGERRFFVNPKKCPTLDKGLKTVQVKKGSTFLEDETNNAQHITTAARYFAEFEFPIHGKPQVRIS